MIKDAQAASTVPAISVIVPVHNGGKHLNSALDSIASQDFRNIEVICVNDASSDESMSILNQWAKGDSRFILKQNDEQQGAGKSRNLGMDVARGDYLMFVDCDDLVSPGALSALYQRAKEDHVALVRGNIREFSTDPNVNTEEIPQVPDAHKIHFAELRELWLPWYHTSWLIERAFLERVGARYPSLELGEDPVFLTRLLTASKEISTIEHLCYEYRHGHKRRVIGEQALLDYVRHAGQVRELFLASGLGRCWTEGYSPEVLPSILYCLDSAQRSSTMSSGLREVMYEVFCSGGEELNLQILERIRNFDLTANENSQGISAHDAIERGLLDRGERKFDQLPLNVDFREHGNSLRFKMGGWSNAEHWGTWTTGGCTRLLFMFSLMAPEELVIDFFFTTAFLHPGRPILDVSVGANGHELAMWEFNMEAGQPHIETPRRLHVPFRLLMPSGALLLSFKLEASQSPFSLGLSLDERRLGVGLAKIRVTVSDSADESPIST